MFQFLFLSVPFTDSGITNDVKAQFLKAVLPIVSIPIGISISFKFEHPSKAISPIVFKLCDNFTEDIFLPLKPFTVIIAYVLLL